MPVQFKVRLFGALDIWGAVTQLHKTIAAGSSAAVGRRLGLEGLRVIRQLTPQTHGSKYRLPGSKRGYKPFYQQWQLIEQLATTSAYQAVIRSKAVGTAGGLVALASVEFGAEPHLITSTRIGRNGRRVPLRWREGPQSRSFLGRQGLDVGADVIDSYLRQSRDGGIVRAFAVDHPGNKPFHMVENTRTQMERYADTLLITYARQIEAIFGRGSLQISVR